MKLPRPPAALVFDMDGLLFDTETVAEEAFLAAAAEAGHQATKPLFRQLVGRPWPANRELLLAHYGAGFAVDVFREVWLRHYQHLLATRLTLKPGVVELLETLDKLKLPRAIATSSSLPTVRHHLTTHGLSARFDAIVAHGDYAAGKPAPDPFLAAAARLDVEPGLCLALEDSHNGVRSAAAAGMMVIMVPDLLEPTEEMRRLSTGVLRDLHEVRRVLLATLQPALP